MTTLPPYVFSIDIHMILTRNLWLWMYISIFSTCSMYIFPTAMASFSLPKLPDRCLRSTCTEKIRQNATFNGTSSAHYTFIRICMYCHCLFICMDTKCNTNCSSKCFSANCDPLAKGIKHVKLTWYRDSDSGYRNLTYWDYIIRMFSLHFFVQINWQILIICSSPTIPPDEPSLNVWFYWKQKNQSKFQLDTYLSVKAVALQSLVC